MKPFLFNSCFYFIFIFYIFFHSSDFSFDHSSNVHRCHVQAVWQRFDLVRNTPGHWGSNWTIPLYRIERPYGLNPGSGVDSKFGFSIANLGDIDKNGVDDIAVGAIGENVGNMTNAGGVYIFLMNKDGNYSKVTLVNGVEANQPKLHTGDQFGYSLATIGDLDRSGVTKLLVGAPGLIISSVYILYINGNAEVFDYTLIRGKYDVSSVGNLTTNSSTAWNGFDPSYTPNGPPIAYGSRFGASVANLGDLNPNYYLAVGVSAISPRGELVYILYINEAGTVQSYTNVTAIQAGITFPLSNFGSSIQILPKISPRDQFFKLAIGTSRLYEASTLSINSGMVFVFHITSEGHVNHTTVLSETSGLQDYGVHMPLVAGDACGTSLTTVGDINKDNERQRHPGRPNWKKTPSIPDLIMGCPQTTSSGGTGRIFFLFLDIEGKLKGFTEIPALTDRPLGLDFVPYEQFGNAVDGYQDLDNNGLREILVGSPRRPNSQNQTVGAFYILFPRRRRYFPGPFDWRAFYCMVIIPPGLFCFFCCLGVAYFFWYFRRKPDPVEIIVKKSGLQVDPSKPRKKYNRGNIVYIDEYTA